MTVGCCVTFLITKHFILHVHSEHVTTNLSSAVQAGKNALRVTTQNRLMLGFQWQRMVSTITIGAKLKSRKRQPFSAKRGIPGFLS